MSNLFTKTEDGVEFPYIEQDGEKRLLAWLPTPSNHKMQALPTWSQRGFPTLKLSDIPEFDRTRLSVPIINQNGKGACLPHAWAAGVMIARDIAGAPFIPLSPWFLYSLINRGVDAGSNAGDACEALMSVGICEEDLVPYGTIGPKGYNQAAADNAKQYLLRDAVKIEGFEQAVTAAYLGWTIPFDTQAGPGFDINSDGVCAYLGTNNNHEVLAEGKYKLINGRPYIGGRNSWGTQWGMKGRCYWTPKHLDNSNETYAIRFVTDSNLPPTMT